jgi:hypothetical protein
MPSIGKATGGVFCHYELHSIKPTKKAFIIFILVIEHAALSSERKFCAITMLNFCKKVGPPEEAVYRSSWANHLQITDRRNT